MTKHWGFFLKKRSHLEVVRQLLYLMNGIPDSLLTYFCFLRYQVSLDQPKSENIFGGGELFQSGNNLSLPCRNKSWLWVLVLVLISAMQTFFLATAVFFPGGICNCSTLI